MAVSITTVVLAVAKSATVIFGVALTWLSYRAFARTRSRSLGALATGIGLLTVGVFFGSTLHYVWHVDLAASVAIESVFTALGFGIVTYSLYTDVIRDAIRTHT